MDALRRLNLPKSKGEMAQAGAAHFLYKSMLMCHPLPPSGKIRCWVVRLPTRERRLLLSIHLLAAVRLLEQAALKASFRDCLRTA